MLKVYFICRKSLLDSEGVMEQGFRPLKIYWNESTKKASTSSNPHHRINFRVSQSLISKNFIFFADKKPKRNGRLFVRKQIKKKVYLAYWGQQMKKTQLVLYLDGDLENSAHFMRNKKVTTIQINLPPKR